MKTLGHDVSTSPVWLADHSSTSLSTGPQTDLPSKSHSTPRNEVRQCFPIVHNAYPRTDSTFTRLIPFATPIPRSRCPSLACPSHPLPIRVLSPVVAHSSLPSTPAWTFASMCPGSTNGLCVRAFLVRASRASHYSVIALMGGSDGRLMSLYH